MELDTLKLIHRVLGEYIKQASSLAAWADLDQENAALRYPRQVSNGACFESGQGTSEHRGRLGR
jgi:hypothetical protein